MSDQNKRIINRLLSLSARAAVTGLVGGLCVLAVIVGRSAISDRNDAVAAPPPVPLPTVIVSKLQRDQGYEVERVFTGQIEARQRTELSFELGGTVAEVLVDEGDTITLNQPLAILDQRSLLADRQRLSASRAALLAQVELAELNTERREKLLAKGFATQRSVDTARLGLQELQHRVAELDASILGVEIQLEKTQLLAPFSGTVVARTMDAGGTATPGRSVLAIVEDGPAIFRVGLPTEVARSLNPATEQIITIGGQAHKARYSRTLSELDAVTRTQAVLFDLPASSTGPTTESLPALFRETGEIRLTQAIDESGFWVPMAALNSGPKGLWQLMSVRQMSDGDQVGSETVEVLTVDGERAFVRGALDNIQSVVIDGAHRVVPGQTVTVVAASPSQSLSTNPTYNQLASN